jgi:hypothetical protein
MCERIPHHGELFWSAAALAAGLVLLVLIMKRSVAEKGAHVGGE